MKKKKILFIGGTTGGGIATINNEVMRIFRESGFDFDLVDTEKMKRRLPKPLAYVVCYVHTFVKIALERPDLVYLQISQTGYAHQSFFLAIAKMLGRETLAHFHAKSDLTGTTTYRQFARILSSQSYTDKAILLTKPSADELVRGGWRKPVYVVPNFISTQELPKELKPVTERRQLLYLGRMNWEKGIYEILEIARRLRDEKFVFVGNIDNHEDQERFTREIETLDNAEWLGPIYGDEKYDVIADSKFLILPTRRDEFPVTLIESTILGCVPLVSNIGSVSEVVKDGFNGFYISPDDIDGIVQTIQRWNSNPALQQISENGIEFAQDRFTADAVTGRLIEIVN